MEKTKLKKFIIDLDDMLSNKWKEKINEFLTFMPKNLSGKEKAKYLKTNSNFNSTTIETFRNKLDSLDLKLDDTNDDISLYNIEKELCDLKGEIYKY